MANNNNNEVQYVTPVGTAKFPYLSIPDTKFDDRGVWKVDLIITSTEAKEIRKVATDLATAFKKKDVDQNTNRKKWGLHLPLLDDVDQDGEETGKMIARFKQTAMLRTRDGREIKKSIMLFDSQGNRITDVNPYSGTKMSVAYTMSTYVNPTGKTYGVTFRLLAVQIIELVEGGSKMSAESLGFHNQEGFVMEQQDADNETEILEAEENSSEANSIPIQSEEGKSEEVPF